MESILDIKNEVVGIVDKHCMRFAASYELSKETVTRVPPEHSVEETVNRELALMIGKEIIKNTELRVVEGDSEYRYYCEGFFLKESPRAFIKDIFNTTFVKYYSKLFGIDK